VHEGNGELQLIIEDRANEEQREAIRRIVYNEDTDEILTHYAVFCSMCTTIYEPIVAPIDLEFDVEARTAHGEVPGVVCEILLQENRIEHRLYYPRDLVVPCWKPQVGQLGLQGLCP
jgi:hypothetical protein